MAVEPFIERSCNPLTTLNIEKLLVDHFLSIKENGDIPLRYVDASPSEIQTALGVATEEEAMAYLTNHCRATKHYFYARDVVLAPTDHLPQCFSHLVLSCHAAMATEDDSDSSNNLRVRLAELLGCRATELTHLRINDCWQHTQAWCQNHAEAYRPIELPGTVGRYTQIGYTLRLAFPTWRDKSRLHKHVQQEDVFSLEQALLALDDENLAAFTLAFQSLFREYKELIQQKEADRLETRFGRFLFDVLAREKIPSVEPSVCLQQDLHGRWIIIDERGKQQAAGLALQSMSTDNRHSRFNIYKLAAQGIVFFEEHGYGQYKAMAKPAECAVGGLAWNNFAPLRVIMNKFPSGIPLGTGWQFLPDLNNKKFGEILEELRCSALLEKVFPVNVFRLEGGFQLQNAFLTRNNLLPLLHVLREGIVSLTSSAGKIIFSEISPANSTFSLERSAAHLKEKCVLRYVGKLHNDTLKKQRNFFFHDAAPFHAKELITTSEFLMPFSETRLANAAPKSLCFQHKHAPPEEVRHACMDDMEEALYFFGRTGWNMQELLRLLHAVLPKQSMAWDMLRCLEESGWLAVGWGKRWGVRRYFLVPHSLIPTPQGILLWGARPRVIRDAFAEAVEKAGGIVQQRGGISEYAPSLLMACHISVESLQQQIEEVHENPWPVEGAARLPQSIAHHPPEVASAQPSSKHVADRWYDWEAGEFTLQKSARSVHKGFTLCQMTTSPDKSYHRLYQLAHDDVLRLTTPVRNAALWEAHKAAQCRLFIFKNDAFCRCGREGYLPLPVARALIHAHAQCSGPGGEGSGESYVYPCAQRNMPAILALSGAVCAEDVFEQIQSPVLGPSYVVHKHRPEKRFLYVSQ